MFNALIYKFEVCKGNRLLKLEQVPRYTMPSSMPADFEIEVQNDIFAKTFTI